MNQKVYIIKPYNKYLLPQRQQRIVYKFNLYDNAYCISQVSLEWGHPIVARLIQEQDDFGYHLYDTYEDALKYVQQLKHFAS